jgi:hypothetical protein
MIYFQEENCKNLQPQAGSFFRFFSSDLVGIAAFVCRLGKGRLAQMQFAANKEHQAPEFFVDMSSDGAIITSP